MQNKPRNVVLCLMEVSRLASRFGLEPPGLVQMEKEIDAEEAREQNGGPDTKISTPNIRHRFVLCTKTKISISIIIIYVHTLQLNQCNTNGYQIGEQIEENREPRSNIYGYFEIGI